MSRGTSIPAVGVDRHTCAIASNPSLWTLFSCFVWLLAALAHTMAPYVNLGQTMPVTTHHTRYRFGPHSCPTEDLMRYKSLVAFFALSLICGPKLSLLSSIIPRYSTDSEYSSTEFPIRRWGRSEVLICLRVKTTASVFSAPNSRLFAVPNRRTLFTASCPCSIRVCMSGPHSRIAASSTKPFCLGWAGHQQTSQSMDFPSPHPPEWCSQGSEHPLGDLLCPQE